ncbi:hypothetical protein JB92DRAFT_1771577 [Gautieria morchelliformis]|nr:hypothetical protein JB92DRAFT_1771577 [Gautieria morchelliformis]
MNVVDARRVEDDVKVILKHVPTATQELPTARYLSSEVLLSDPRNHTVRILDVILLPGDDEWALPIIPYLKQFDDLSFPISGRMCRIFPATAPEFMHEHNVAHRDACHGNIMMDSSRLIPKGFHFTDQWSHTGVPSAEGFTYTTRLAVTPVDYFSLDFGLSTRFASLEDRHLVTGMACQKKKVPELSYAIPYDPFKVDIYHLGGVFVELVEVCSSL